MAMLGINLEEVNYFTQQMNRLKSKILELESAEDEIFSLISKEQNKQFIRSFVRFLQYTSSIDPDKFYCYRVRTKEEDTPYVNKSDLLYPPVDKNSTQRMNGKDNIVLYVSLNEFTAISECRIKKIGQFFQLTKFEITKPINFFEIGRFSNIFFNTPRDSEEMKKYIDKYIGYDVSNSFIKEISALECAIIEILYNKEDYDYYLTSFIADAIFDVMPKINAIKYPSMQNKFGTNFAIKKNFVDDAMKIAYSNFNCIKEVYDNGFYKYNTLFECANFHDKNLKYDEIKNGYSNNQYR